MESSSNAKIVGKDYPFNYGKLTVAIDHILWSIIKLNNISTEAAKKHYLELLKQDAKKALEVLKDNDGELPFLTKELLESGAYFL